MSEESTIDDNMKEKDPIIGIDRHFKKRVFVREIAGVYGEIYKNLLKQPRVYKPKGPKVINPQSTEICQAIETHLETCPPGWHNVRHGHMNSAVFYVLEGQGYDIHDGVRFDYKEGDAFIIENGCVHEHCNNHPEKNLRLLVTKGKPLFLFFNLLFQKQQK